MFVASVVVSAVIDVNVDVMLEDLLFWLLLLLLVVAVVVGGVGLLPLELLLWVLLFVCYLSFHFFCRSFSSRNRSKVVQRIPTSNFLGFFSFSIHFSPFFRLLTPSLPPFTSQGVQSSTFKSAQQKFQYFYVYSLLKDIYFRKTGKKPAILIELLIGEYKEDKRKGGKEDLIIY